MALAAYIPIEITLSHGLKKNGGVFVKPSRVCLLLVNIKEVKKTHQLNVYVYSIPEKLDNAAITSYFVFVFEDISASKII